MHGHYGKAVLSCFVHWVFGGFVLRSGYSVTGLLIPSCAFQWWHSSCDRIARLGPVSRVNALRLFHALCIDPSRLRNASYISQLGSLPATFMKCILSSSFVLAAKNNISWLFGSEIRAHVTILAQHRLADRSRGCIIYEI